MIYFIGDMHLGHDNIIKLCNRPFSSGREMDGFLINSWNSVVNPEDTVYILGDFAFKSVINPVEILKKLNGHKILIIGNHDKQNLKNPEFRRCFIDIKDMLSIYINNEKIVMCHYPIVEWEGYFRGAWHIYGHVHNNVRNKSWLFLKDESHALNAGADIIGFKPVTFEELIICNNNFRLQNR